MVRESKINVHGKKKCNIKENGQGMQDQGTQ